VRTIAKIALTVAVLTAATSALGVLADEGRIPLFQVTTITQPGHYVVTRNISVSSGSIFTISANDVTLDLNGHLISSSISSASMINILAGFTDIEIRNGRISGGQFGIFSSDSPVAGIRMRIENVEIEGATVRGIRIDFAEHVDVLSCRIANVGGGIEIGGGSSGAGPQDWTGTFVNNQILNAQGHGMLLLRLTGGEIRGNILRNTGLAIGNTWVGIYVLTSGAGNRIVENEVSGGKRGIQVDTNGNLVAGNVVSNNVVDGILVSGSNNLIDGNQIEGNTGCGISFSAGATHAYRNNMLRGNTGGTVCGIANTDAGGNIF